MLTMLIDNTVKMGIGLGAFNNPVNVPIDEHDEPYTGKGNPYLIDAPFHKFRGTDMAYRFATLDCAGNNRFTLAAMVKHQLDGIGNAKEVRMLIGHALPSGIKINTVLMDRGYLDSDVMNAVDSMKLKYIIPAKDNEKVKKFKKMDLKYCKDKYGNEFSFIVIRDSIGSIKKANANFVHIIELEFCINFILTLTNNYFNHNGYECVKHLSVIWKYLYIPILTFSVNWLTPSDHVSVR